MSTAKWSAPAPRAASEAARATNARSVADAFRSSETLPLDLDKVLPSAIFFDAPAPQAPPGIAGTPGLEPSAARSRARTDKDWRSQCLAAGLPEPGVVVDKYRLDELLGMGSFAAVYRALHLVLRSQVAIKIFRPEALKRHANLGQLLLSEARFGANINHENVARIYDACQTESFPYLVMEYVEGHTLAHEIAAQGALAVGRVLGLARDVVAGLRAGAERGLIHRDIKPSNIMLTPRGRAKVVDLGLATRNELEFGLELDAPATQLKVAGTYAYMAPEQLRDPMSVDFRADIFSLGTTLLEALLGASGVTVRSREQCLQLHARAPAPLPRHLLLGDLKPFGKLLDSMRAYDPAARPQSYSEIDATLAHIERALGYAR